MLAAMALKQQTPVVKPASADTSTIKKPGVSVALTTDLLNSSDFLFWAKSAEVDPSRLSIDLSSDQLETLKSTGESEITVPAGIDLTSLAKNGGEVFLSVDLSQADIQSSELRSVVMTLKNNSSGQWEVLISPDASTDAGHKVLSSLLKVKIFFQSKPAPSPSPVASPSPDLSSRADVIINSLQTAE